MSKAIQQQHDEDLKRFQLQQKNEYKYIKARLKRVGYLKSRYYSIHSINIFSGIRKRLRLAENKQRKCCSKSKYGFE